MPKLVRSNRCSNYPAARSVSSPSALSLSASPLLLPLPQSPLTPPWNTTPHHHQQQQHQQQRKVSEEDMYQNHRDRTQTSSSTSRSSVDTHDVSSSFSMSSSSSSSSDYDFETPKSLSSVSTALSSTSFTTNLKRRKPSVCLTDLLQPEPEEKNKNTSARAIVSPTMTSLNHFCHRPTNDAPPQPPPQHPNVTSSRYETGGSSASAWWGQFTTMTNEDSFFVNDLEEHDEEEARHFSQSDDSWDYNTVANTTSFIPIQQRPNPTSNHHYHHRQHYNSTYSSPCTNHMQSYGGATTNISPSLSHCSTGSGNSSHNTKTSWRMALTATSLTPKSRNSDYDHHNHPYIYKKNTYPTMKRQHIISLSTISSHPHSSIDRFRHNKNHSTDSEQQPMQSTISSSSSSLFDEFILTCPTSDRCYDDQHCNTDGSIDVATQRMSVLGL
jgi:hypothetical protein